MSAVVIPFTGSRGPVPAVNVSVAPDGTHTVSISPCPREWPKPEAEFWDGFQALNYADRLAERYGCGVHLEQGDAR